MKAYKGFDKNLKCRGFQYEIGCEYKTDKAMLCTCGFHACQAPLKVWDFYPPVYGNRFCEVEQDGSAQSEGVNGKCVATKIKIGAELGIHGLVKAHVEWCQGRNTTARELSCIASNVDSAKIGSSRDGTKIGSSGYDVSIGSSGDDMHIGSIGESAKIGSSGESAKIGSSGYSAQIGSGGDFAKIGSSGPSAKIGSSGYSAQIGSSGDHAKIGSSGDYARIGSSGNYAKIGSSGDCAKIKCDGKNSVVACIGSDSIVNAPVGTWVCLSEYGVVDNELVCVNMKAFRIDGKKYKANTWYMLKGGKIMKVSVSI